MEAIVHIGLPKTGSTAIQNYLATHARALARQGFHYETGSWLGDGNHFKLPLAALSHGGLRLNAASAEKASWLGQPDELPTHGTQALTKLRSLAEKKTMNRAIFSSEFLSFWLREPEDFAALHDLMTSLFSPVRYIAYFRAPVSHAESDYNQHIKSGLTGNFEPFARLYPQKIEEWADRVLMLAKCAGANAMDIRTFDRAAFKGGSLIEDFCDAVGLETLPSRDFPASNETLSTTGVRMLRAVNRALPADMSEAEAHKLRKELLALIPSITAGSEKLAMPAALATHVHEKSQPALARVSEALRPDAPLEFAPPQGRPKTSEIDEDDTALIEMMAKLIMETTLTQKRKATFTGVAEGATKLAIARARAICREFGAKFQGGRL